MNDSRSAGELYNRRRQQLPGERRNISLIVDGAGGRTRYIDILCKFKTVMAI